MSNQEYILHEIAEQDAIFDGKPDFLPSGLIINVLNHNAIGGSEEDMKNVRQYARNPVRYKVRVSISYLPYEDVERQAKRKGE